MSGWRAPLPNEIIVELSRWQIEDMTWRVYEDLCRFPNRCIHAPDYHGDFVQWIIPEDSWVWLMLCYPELSECRHVTLDRSPRPYTAFPSLLQGRRNDESDQ